ncbi:MAG: Nif3-like dinuclear metal center hexameric protein [Planctomycetes bacterium]|nr:Nif3-like dinuclear metal center hexameric protein [Planctomycetota bacterium]
MTTVADITQFLEEFAPLRLAEDWDNVGLLVGDGTQDASALMTCLTLSPDVAAEAVRRNAGMIVTHHPVLFRPVQRLTSETAEGRMLLDLIAKGIAVFSPHTAYDSAKDGINQQLAELFQLNDIQALRPIPNFENSDHNAKQPAQGAGRCGSLPVPVSLGDFLERVKAKLGIDRLQFVGNESTTIEKIGIACGSAAEFMQDAQKKNCQALLTGEARFHACFEAVALDIALVLAGHYATERPAVERLAEILQKQFSQLEVWASESETDPLNYR